MSKIGVQPLNVFHQLNATKSQIPLLIDILMSIFSVFIKDIHVVHS